VRIPERQIAKLQSKIASQFTSIQDSTSLCCASTTFLYLAAHSSKRSAWSRERILVGGKRKSRLGSMGIPENGMRTWMGIRLRTWFLSLVLPIEPFQDEIAG
jgi:hypothetical protein